MLYSDKNEGFLKYEGPYRTSAKSTEENAEEKDTRTPRQIAKDDFEWVLKVLKEKKEERDEFAAINSGYTRQAKQIMDLWRDPKFEYANGDVNYMVSDKGVLHYENYDNKWRVIAWNEKEFDIFLRAIKKNW